jgi:hypothetical protein
VGYGIAVKQDGAAVVIKGESAEREKSARESKEKVVKLLGGWSRV